MHWGLSSRSQLCVVPYTCCVNFDANEDIYMQRITYVQPADVLGDPEPALLVDGAGAPARATAPLAADPSTWAISTSVPSEPFVVHLLNADMPHATALVAPGGSGLAALVIALQLGGWQHRVVLPLLGPTVAAYLAALKAAGRPVGLELCASAVAQVRRFDVCVADETLAQALALNCPMATSGDTMPHRRAMGMHCLTMRGLTAVPAHPMAGRVQTVTLGRVWPVELLIGR